MSADVSTPPTSLKPRDQVERKVEIQPKQIEVNLEPLEAEDDDIPCAACGSGEVEDGNDIIFCDGCDVAVHVACYNLSDTPEGEFFCVPCARKVRPAPSCELCGHTGGIMRASDGGMSGYAHVSCAIWMPETEVFDKVLGVTAVDPERRKLTCLVCHQRGACVQCDKGACVRAFHPSCGLSSAGKEAGVVMRVEDLGDDTLEVQRLLRCPKHASDQPSAPRKRKHTKAGAKATAAESSKSKSRSQQKEVVRQSEVEAPKPISDTTTDPEPTRRASKRKSSESKENTTEMEADPDREWVAPSAEAPPKRGRTVGGKRVPPGVKPEVWAAADVKEIKRTLKSLESILADQVDDDWHDGYEEQGETIVEYMQALQAPAQTAHDLLVTKNHKALSRAHEIIMAIGASWDGMLTIPMRGDIESSHDEMVVIQVGGGHDDFSSLSVPWVVEMLFRGLLLAAANAGVESTLLARYIRDAYDFDVDVDIEKLTAADGPDAAFYGGSEKLAAALASKDWFDLPKKRRVRRMRRAIDRRFDGTPERRTRDYHLYDDDDGGGGCHQM